MKKNVQNWTEKVLHLQGDCGKKNEIFSVGKISGNYPAPQ